MDKIKDLAKSTKLRVAYNKLVTEVDISEAPKDLQQIRNKKYYEKKKTNSETTKGAKNLADQLQIISSMSIDEPSIRMVKTDKNFGVVIFSENQINDVQRFCCSAKLF